MATLVEKIIKRVLESDEFRARVKAVLVDLGFLSDEGEPKPTDLEERVTTQARLVASLHKTAMHNRGQIQQLKADLQEEKNSLGVVRMALGNEQQSSAKRLKRLDEQMNTHSAKIASLAKRAGELDVKTSEYYSAAREITTQALGEVRRLREMGKRLSETERLVLDFTQEKFWNVLPADEENLRALLAQVEARLEEIEDGRLFEQEQEEQKTAEEE